MKLHSIKMEPITILQFCLIVLPSFPPVEDPNHEHGHQTRPYHGQPCHYNILARKDGNLCLPQGRIALRVGDYVHLAVGDDLGPRVGVVIHGHPQRVDKVGRHAEAEYCVGRLQGEVSRLRHLGGSRVEPVKRFRSRPL